MLELTALDREDRVPLEVECLAPDAVRDLSLAEIEKLPVYHGNRQACLADFFSVRGAASDAHVRLLGDCSAVKWIGHAMREGHIVVEGDIGMHLGSEMEGGRIEVRGDAGDWVGGEMVGGHIQVWGRAGHLVGGAYRGSSVGMKGGTILIHGDAGNEIGGCMRRGLIAIGGRCGDFAGVAMLAGSIFVFGVPGIRMGAGMKRGTIALFGSGQPALLPTFRYDCDIQPQFLALYLSQLRGWEFPLTRDYDKEGCFARYNGDLLEIGKGEVLAWRECQQPDD